MPKFRFDVDWETIAHSISFQEVIGLEIDKQVEQSGFLYVITSIFQKVFSRHKFRKVVLKNVIFTSDKVLIALNDLISDKKVFGQRVVVNLLDEEGKATLIWTLKNARVRKLSFSNLRSDANELAGYSVEVVHEGIQLTISKERVNN